MLGHKRERMTSYNSLMFPRSILFKSHLITYNAYLLWDTHSRGYERQFFPPTRWRSRDLDVPYGHSSISLLHHRDGFSCALNHINRDRDLRLPEKTSMLAMCLLRFRQTIYSDAKNTIGIRPTQEHDCQIATKMINWNDHVCIRRNSSYAIPKECRASLIWVPIKSSKSNA